MLKLIPAVKNMNIHEGVWKNAEISYQKGTLDPRVERALSELPQSENGIPVRIAAAEDTIGSEAYELQIDANGISLKAGSPEGAFYAVQTLKQIIANGEIPYLEIQDKPDFPYRGFYHDVTRGKIPTVETMKQLIDQMAYYKMNSLQIYVEHVYEFEECRELNKTLGYYTKEELKEMDEYCKERFIDFIPSLSAFTHMYEVLELDQYKHLRVLKDYQTSENRWHERMAHHTINPLLQESEDLVMSLIDQYIPAFSSETFNICCDEPFDLGMLETDMDTKKLYVDFTGKIIDHVRDKGKKIMMWGDILVEHPECIPELPEDVVFLNWDYSPEVSEDKVKKFSDFGRKQIVCPGTGSWRRLCEDVVVEEQNISNMINYGHKYGALGVLNTNWGDWGNPASIEMAMYGLVLGAAKSWSVNTEADTEFYDAVNHLLYGADNAVQMLREVSCAQDEVKWMPFTMDYLESKYKKEMEPELPKKVFTAESAARVQAAYRACREQLSEQTWNYEEAREEMLLCAEGICVMAELTARKKGIDIVRLTDTESWLERFSAKWNQKNKPCELSTIQDMFLYMEHSEL